MSTNNSLKILFEISKITSLFAVTSVLVTSAYFMYHNTRFLKKEAELRNKHEEECIKRMEFDDRQNSTNLSSPTSQ
jgi:beta-lactamase regulating signal transducer with metallopeptidase domain